MLVRNLCAVAIVLLFAGDNLSKPAALAEDAPKPKFTTAEVMKKGMKEQLWRKAAEGTADQQQKTVLVEMFTALKQNKPPRGDEKSWQAKTDALIAAAKAVAAGEDKAGEKLTAAVNCSGCHKVHK